MKSWDLWSAFRNFIFSAVDVQMFSFLIAPALKRLNLFLVLMNLENRHLWYHTNICYANGILSGGINRSKHLDSFCEFVQSCSLAKQGADRHKSRPAEGLRNFTKKEAQGVPQRAINHDCPHPFWTNHICNVCLKLFLNFFIPVFKNTPAFIARQDKCCGVAPLTT